MTLLHSFQTVTLFSTQMTLESILSSNIDNLKELIRKVEDTLRLAKTYFNANGLMLNTKNKTIFIGTRRLISVISPNTHLMVDVSVITPSTSVKNLGIYFDNHLSIDTSQN